MRGQSFRKSPGSCGEKRDAWNRQTTLFSRCRRRPAGSSDTNAGAGRPWPCGGPDPAQLERKPLRAESQSTGAASRAVNAGAYYSFPLQDELKQTLAHKPNLTAAHIELSTGSNEALCAACQAWGWPGPIIAPALTYSAHLSYASKLGMTVTELP